VLDSVKAHRVTTAAVQRGGRVKRRGNRRVKHMDSEMTIKVKLDISEAEEAITKLTELLNKAITLKLKVET